MLPLVIGDTRIQQVNSTAQGERDVKWGESEYWILVGGQKLDRGFTVEGLTITYMPRSIGTGTADTLQQRARFFGYKKAYKGLCRVFLIRDVAVALAKYVEHEEFVREALREFQGRPLLEWKRDFILTRMLSPTRPSVISLDTDRVILNQGWTFPGHLYVEDDAIADNRRLFSEVRERWTKAHGVQDAAAHKPFKDKRTDSPRNLLIEGVPLQEVLERFLLRVRVPYYDDSTTQIAITLALRAHLKEHPDSVSDVFVIGDMTPQVRSLTSTGRINQVFQGKNPNVNDFEKLIYVGDHALFAPSRPTLHVRAYDIRRSKDDRHPVAADVPWFALHLPKEYVKDTVIEGGARRV